MKDSQNLLLVDGTWNYRPRTYVPCITAFGDAGYDFIICFIYEQFGNYCKKKMS